VCGVGDRPEIINVEPKKKGKEDRNEMQEWSNKTLSVVLVAGVDANRRSSDTDADSSDSECLLRMMADGFEQDQEVMKRVC
jgi:hypothetical protein